MKNMLDSIFFTRLFVSERKQIALIADEKLHTQISRCIFATKSLRNEDNMLKLKKEDYEKILGHAKAGLPNEACGLLGGYEEDGNQVVTDVYLLRNVDESREHFSMDPAEQLAAVKDIRSKGRTLLGNFHSHPESPSRPSKEDIRLAYDSKMHYLILSLMEEQPVLNSFHIEKGNVTKEELTIE